MAAVSEHHVPRVVTGTGGDQFRHQFRGYLVFASQEVQEFHGRQIIRRREHDVLRRSGEHHIRAVARGYDIVAPLLGIGAEDLDYLSLDRQSRFAVVTENDVGRRVVAAGEDKIISAAAEHHIGTVSDVDDVDIALERRRGIDAHQLVTAGDRLELRQPTVSEHHVPRVVTGTGGDQFRHQLRGHLILASQETQELHGRQIVGRREHDVLCRARKHHIRAVAGGNDVVAAVLGIGAFDPYQDLVSDQTRLAVVTENDIRGRVAAAGKDKIVGAAAEHHIRTVSDVDDVDVALERRGGIDARETARPARRIEERNAAVAEYHVPRRVARPGGDKRDYELRGEGQVAAENGKEAVHRGFIARGKHYVLRAAGEYRVRPVARNDEVVPSKLRSRRFYSGKESGACKIRPPVITENHVGRAVATGEDDVVGRTAENHIRAVSGEDVVVVPKLEIAGLDSEEHAGIGEGRPTVVTEDYVGYRRVSGVDFVRVAAADYDVGTVAAFYIIVAAVLGRDGFETDQITRHRIERRVAVVAEDDIRRGVAAGIDAVISGAAEDHIRAIARDDGVVTPAHRIDGIEGGDNTEGETGLPVVTHDDVVGDIRRRGDYRIVAEASEDDIESLIAVALVVAAHVGMPRVRIADRPLYAVGFVTGTAVSEDRLRSAAEELHLTAVVEDDVVGGTALDGIVSVAAEDKERECRSRGVYGVVVGHGFIVVRPLGVEDEDVVLPEVDVDHHIVVAQPGIQCGDGHDSIAVAVDHVPEVGAVDLDVVGAPSRPDRHAVGEVTAVRAVVRAEGDGSIGQPDYIDLRIRPLCIEGVVTPFVVGVVTGVR